jgi:multisubunit Na+/H+ antiporter MnhB subunit
MYLLLLQSSMLEWFLDDSSPSNWEEVATTWLITTVVVSILVVGLVFTFKGLRKSMAEIAKKKIWTRRQTWLLIFVGMLPIFLVVALLWYFNDDFRYYAGIGGLAKGILVGWLLYIVLMSIGHLVSPWRRELI